MSSLVISQKHYFSYGNLRLKKKKIQDVIRAHVFLRTMVLDFVCTSETYISIQTCANNNYILYLLLKIWYKYLYLYY